jgi:signal transduction histidine kinase
MAAMSTRVAKVRSFPQPRGPRNPISRKQVESVISRSIAGFGIVFGAQTVPVMLGQIAQAQPVWVNFVVIPLFASLILAAFASVVRRFVRAAHGLVSVVYLVALVTWPMAVIDPTRADPSNHWLYFLLTVATATAAIAFSTRVATLYLFIVPTIYGFIHALPAGGNATLTQSALDSIYSIILGGAIMIIVTMLRQASASVDNAQATALDRYSHAVRQHATEVERVQVDAIVHDSVLTTFISAARAFTPEAKELAATMATNAIGHLHDAALVPPDDGTTLRLREVAQRITDAAASMSPAFELRVRDLGPRAIPVQAAEAVASAATQAMVNSLQHAGSSKDLRRWLNIHGIRPTGIIVEIGDTGEGFDVDSVPTERLGVRVSIIERVSNAGGTTTIRSAVGKGTVVFIRWPAEEPRASLPVQDDTAADQQYRGARL